MISNNCFMKKVNSLLDDIIILMSAFLSVFVLLELCTRVYITHFSGEQTCTQYVALKLTHRNRYKFNYTPNLNLRYYPTPIYERWKNKLNSLRYCGDA
jgi:hypothetical protein